MKHWIFDLQATALPNWREAMPQAAILGREKIYSFPPDEPGLLWFRLKANEVLGEVLPHLSLGQSQRLILLCDDPSEALVMQALTAGAAGCCNTHAAPDVLHQVALVVDNGGMWIGQSLLQQLVSSTTRLLDQKITKVKNSELPELLSERELQVAQLVARGASNKEIAEQLFFSERTAKAHLSSIFDKLDVRDRLQLSLKINGLTV